MEEEREYGRVRGNPSQKDDDALHEDDGVATKLALEIEKKELKIMKNELAMQLRLHPARSHSSDEDSDRVGSESRRKPHHNSQMNASGGLPTKRVGSSLRRELGMESKNLL
jgi:hypothetical protein